MTEVVIRELPLKTDARELFSRLRSLPGAFLLYSGQGFSGHRFDIFSALPEEQIRLQQQTAADFQSLNTAIEQMIQRLSRLSSEGMDLPSPGWFGLLAYPDQHADSNAVKSAQTVVPLPSLVAGFYPVIFVRDSSTNTLFQVSLLGHDTTADVLLQQLKQKSEQSVNFTLTQPWQANMSREQYSDRFNQVQNYLHAGDCYQVNLAQRFTASYSGEPWDAFRHLTNVLPAPMSCYFADSDFTCLSLSPERFLSAQNRTVFTSPIKGTRPRFTDPDQDQASADELRQSEKDRAENLMIVDLLRNDLGRTCEPGTIKVNQLFALESYANVHHMVSHIEGRLPVETHPLQALLAAFPGGSITGAPKKRAMEIIGELEPSERSFYCGNAFYCDISGRLDSSILIRTLICAQQQIHCWGGGGIVADSDADAEYEETLHKVGLILRALE